MRLFPFRPAFGFAGWASVPFWWESAPKDLFFLWCSDGNACPSDIGIIDFSLFAFSPQLVTIKTVSKDTKQIPSQAVTGSGQLFSFQIIAGLTNSKRPLFEIILSPCSIQCGLDRSISPCTGRLYISSHKRGFKLHVLIQPSTYFFFVDFVIPVKSL